MISRRKAREEHSLLVERFDRIGNQAILLEKVASAARDFLKSRGVQAISPDDPGDWRGEQRAEENLRKALCEAGYDTALRHG